MKRIVDHSWFIAIEFICIILAVLLWRTLPGLSWQPLIIAIAPLLLRISAGRSPLVRTPFDVPIAIFLLTAVVGIWAAYQPAAAWTKFWLLLTSILIYYLLSRQSADNLWKVAIVICLMGFGISIYFFLSNNWEVQPQKFQDNKPDRYGLDAGSTKLTLESFHPNDIAGIAAITLPFSLALHHSILEEEILFPKYIVWTDDKRDFGDNHVECFARRLGGSGGFCWIMYVVVGDNQVAQPANTCSPIWSSLLQPWDCWSAWQ